ncbi:MAG: LON peptidase substrate-binding domain-containing protein [Nitrospirota bacterium]|nr:LON peptidase substrate-binding domain-containing protein [Nitrospirota bacterium]
MFLEPERDKPHRELSGKAQPFPVPERIPIFPLPNVVFFPKTYLPLHVFEPRYRQMVADAAAGGQCIGMALLKEGWEEQYDGNPPIFPVGSVGRLASVQNLSDGRSNILLQGIERYEVREEFFEKSYREARITLKPRDRDFSMDSPLRRYLLGVLDEYLQTDEEASPLHSLIRPDVSDEVLVNSLSTYLDCTPLEKQFLLEAEHLPQQARRLSDLIQFKLAERRGAGGWG